MNMLSRLFPEAVRPYAGRIVLTGLGFISAVLFMTLGFWRTLLLLILTAIGFLLGKWEDGALDLGRIPLPGRRR